MLRHQHGGDCCGITHISGFQLDNEGTKAGTLRSLDTELEVIEAQVGAAPCEGSRLVEAVLAGGQIPMWEKDLLDRGFARVSSFKNANSGNTCVVYHAEI